MKGPAQLADFSGTGALQRERTEGGDTVFTGLWQADDPEHAYDALHRLYMARERVRFRGPVGAANRDKPKEETLEVIILEWSNEEHPAALKLQGPADEF
jgi:hypothetical protein